jgi:hypothetical protein
LKGAIVKTPSDKLPRVLLKIAEEELNLIKLKLEESQEISVKLDLEVTPELEERAKVRELIRKIQQKRKEIGLGLDQKINVKSGWLPESTKLKKLLKRKALIEELQKGKFSVKKAS